ncbi:IS3 family transposase [Paenibacillus sp. VTT E-133291]|uniref:IS3 family transposase n=1 Tax=Paenibacillus sp. VTT E-133291 TaxID=1986223 RepID=UPI0027B92E27|nr:IS3 family transposase [Paenibacillus sp. VTT E-133291]
MVLRMVGVLESTYYARKQRQEGKEKSTETFGKVGRPIPAYSLTKDGQKVSDEQIGEWLSEIVAGEEHGYGYRNLAHALYIQHDLILNHKKAYRLCKKLGLLQKKPDKKVKYPRRLAQNRIVTGANQLWQMDIKYGYIHGYDRFFFIFDMIDVFDRCIVGYHLGASCSAKEICATIKQALKQRVQLGEAMPILRSDNGPQFLSHTFAEMCMDKDEPLIHERIPPKTPNMNAYIESFHSILERDLYRKMYFETFEEAYETVAEYIGFYNERRFHGSLNRLSPNQYHAAWRAGQMGEVKISL